MDAFFAPVRSSIAFRALHERDSQHCATSRLARQHILYLALGLRKQQHIIRRKIPAGAPGKIHPSGWVFFYVIQGRKFREICSDPGRRQMEIFLHHFEAYVTLYRDGINGFIIYQVYMPCLLTRLISYG